MNELFDKLVKLVDELPVVDEYLEKDLDAINMVSRNSVNYNVNEFGYWEVPGNPLEISEHVSVNYGHDNGYYYTACTDGYSTWGSKDRIVE